MLESKRKRIVSESHEGTYYGSVETGGILSYKMGGKIRRSFLRATDGQQCEGGLAGRIREKGRLNSGRGYGRKYCHTQSRWEGRIKKGLFLREKGEEDSTGAQGREEWLKNQGDWEAQLSECNRYRGIGREGGEVFLSPGGAWAWAEQRAAPRGLAGHG